MANDKYLSLTELEAGLEHVRQAPQNGGVLVLMARRPMTDEREILEQAELDVSDGLVGDNWRVRGSSRTADGSAHPEMQLTLMNSRLISLIAQEPERWALAGDQLFVDLDLSASNVPPGTKLALGSAVIEVTGQPHTGCQKFAERFGTDALKFINSSLGRQLQLRGINAKVVQSGVIRVGNVVRKV
jgi:hypothetical protein